MPQPAAAQRLLHPDRSARARKTIAEFEQTLAAGRVPAATSLRCSVNRYPTLLTYTFARQVTFYTFVPFEQIAPKGAVLRLVFRVQPDGGAAPAYFESVHRFPNLPENFQDAKKLEWYTGSYFQAGEGNYRVDLLLRDQEGRTCSKSWKLRNRLSRTERRVVRMKPGEVGPLVSLRLPSAKQLAERPFRVSVFLHATPLSLRRTTLRYNDYSVLIPVVTRLFEDTAFAPRTLAAFNLQEQRVVYRTTQVTTASLPDLFDQMQAMELNKVDLKSLENRRGPVELLQRLVAEELAAEDPPDAIVFIGPPSRYDNAISKEAAETLLETRTVPVFDLVPGTPRETRFPDAVERLTEALGGRALTFYDAKGLVTALEAIESAVREASGKPAP